MSRDALNKFLEGKVVQGQSTPCCREGISVSVEIKSQMLFSMIKTKGFCRKFENCFPKHIAQK